MRGFRKSHICSLNRLRPIGLSGIRDLAGHGLAQERLEGVGCDQVDGSAQAVREEAIPFQEGEEAYRAGEFDEDIDVAGFCSPRETEPKTPIRFT